MSGRWRGWIGAGVPIALVAALLIAGLMPASAQTEIRVLDREGPYEKDLDLGKSGFSAGDVVMESHPLVDAADGTTIVGRDFERLTVLRIHSGGEDFLFIYDSTLRLEGGDVVVYGEGRFSDLFSSEGVAFAVVGGTGMYAGAGGTATFSATDTEGEFQIVVDLTG